MGICFSVVRREGDGQQCVSPQACEIQRLPSQVLVSIFSLLPQQELLTTIPLVCKLWQKAAQHSARSLHLNLSSCTRQLQVPQLLYWLESNSQHLQQLQLSTSKPLGLITRRALLRSLSYAPASMYQQMALQLDLEAYDLEFLGQQICKKAPMLRSLKLQPVKPSVQDLQLLVLACILGNLVGADTPGPVLPHLPDCGKAVDQLVATVTQLQSLSLSRYQLGNTHCVSSATQLTSLSLQHCSLPDTSLHGLTALTRLQQLVLSDNLLSTGALQHLSGLSQLTHLDLSVMPSIGRMRGSAAADLGPISHLQALQDLNIVGLGVANACPLSCLKALSRLEIGLNPLTASSLRIIGQLPSLQHLELGGISQAWVLGSMLAPSEALRTHDSCWYGVTGLQHVTYLDLGGSNFNNAVWVGHVCPLLCAMPSLKRLHLAHCHIPDGKLLQLMIGLRMQSSVAWYAQPQIQDLNLDRCSLGGPGEMQALVQLTSLTKLSLASLTPKLGNKEASLLAQLKSLKSLSARNNNLGSKGVEQLAKGLSKLTCLDWSENKRVGKKANKQWGHLLATADALCRAELETNYW